MLVSGRVPIMWCIHPQKLTWNLEMMVSNRNLLFQGSIFRFHVCFGGCILYTIPGMALPYPSAGSSCHPSMFSCNLYHQKIMRKIPLSWSLEFFRKTKKNIWVNYIIGSFEINHSNNIRNYRNIKETPLGPMIELYGQQKHHLRQYVFGKTSQFLGGDVNPPNVILLQVTPTHTSVSAGPRC